MEQEKKPWYESLTVWGAALTTVFLLILPITGRADLAKVVSESQVDISNTLTAIGGIVGTILTIIGRVKATKKLTT